MALPQGPFYRALGEQIRLARKAAKITQAQLANVAGLSRTSITNIETGRQPIYAHTLARVADVLGKPIIDFFPRTKRLQVASDASEQLQRLDAGKRRWVVRILETANPREAPPDGTEISDSPEESARPPQRSGGEKAASANRQARALGKRHRPV